jgi:alkanesulfonate monooxygenase SsuD/methylene tetrahydromethanopterin reductase-like flavin-dependent oxidoreductase (luciferase family)
MEALTTIALQADYSGCGHFWVTEAWGLEAFTTVGHLASITKRIKIGTGVVNIFSRSAGTIGMACATMNQLAPGRFLLGLGTSGSGLVESFHGIKFERPLKRTEEYVEAINKIQSGEPVDYNGEILKLSRFSLFATPVKPAVPIYIGAIGDKNLTLAGKIADGAIVTLYPLSKIAHCVELVNQADASKRKKVFAYIPLRIANNEREEASAKLEISKLISFYIASMGKYYAANLSKLGFVKQLEQIKSAASSGGSAEGAKAISDEFLSEFALIGRPVQILDRLARLPEEIHPVFAMRATSPKEGDASARTLRELSVELARRKPRAI